MVYVIVNKQGKRIKKDNKTTPSFQYPIQAYNYITRHLGNSKMATIKKVGKK